MAYYIWGMGHGIFDTGLCKRATQPKKGPMTSENNQSQLESDQLDIACESRGPWRVCSANNICNREQYARRQTTGRRNTNTLNVWSDSHRQAISITPQKE